MTKTLLATAILALACTSAPVSSPTPSGTGTTGPRWPKLGLNDVSVLVPLPRTPDEKPLLAPTDTGVKGRLLPKTVLDAVPRFPFVPADGLDAAPLRAVGVRFDGCFPGKAGCEPQIRVVLQPVKTDGTALDSALHLFFRLTEDELVLVTTELRRLRTLAPEVADAPLDVHAALVAQGPDGAYGSALRDLVLTYAGEQNLSRVTFFLRAPPQQETWFLGGFDRVDGKLEVIEIVGVGKGNQRVIRTNLATGWQYVLTPEGNSPEDGRVLLDSATADAATDDARRKAYASFLRVENPDKHGPDALPCAGCHVSTFVADEAGRRFGLKPADFPGDAFTSGHDLTVRGGASRNPTSLRAFGWFQKEPMLSQRVVNESAAVVDDLERRFPSP
ncbi:MAG: hypothetical protein RL199_176 [Pseudomonadota bacterium]|jgi:hypothetical protein